MINFSAFADELVKIAKEKELSKGERAATIAGGAVGGAAGTALGIRAGEAFRHSSKIRDAAAKGRSSVTLRYLKGRGYAIPAALGAVGGGGMAAWMTRKKGQK